MWCNLATRFTISDGQITYGDTILGPATNIYADFNEQLDGATSVTMPGRLDYVFATDHGVVGVESKKLNDLTSSHVAGRLHRQMEFLMESVDIPCLLFRGGDAWTRFDDLLLRDDLTKLQAMGLFLIFGPLSDKGVLKCLTNYQSMVNGQRDMRTPFARVEKPPSKGTQAERAMQRLLKGVGPVAAKKLCKVFTNVHGVLDAYLNGEITTLKEAGANKTILKSIHQALGKRGNP